MLRIVFTEATGFVAWVIRKLTRSRASHVGFQLDNNLYFHADKGGVQYSDKRDFLLQGERRIIAAFDIKPEMVDQFDIEWAKGKLGTGYDYLGLVGEIIPMLSWRWFHVKLGDPLNQADKYWCSEFIVATDTSMLVPEFQKIDPRTVTPGQLLRVMKKGNSFVPLDVKGI